MTGMAILLFILTLTSSPYAAIAVLCWSASVCNALYTGSFRHWSRTYLPALAALSVLPLAMQKASDWFEPIGSIDPIYILIGTIVLALPFIIFFAYRRQKSTFTYLAAASVVIGILFIFSADFIFNDVLQDHQRKRIEVLLGMKDDPA